MITKRIYLVLFMLVISACDKTSSTDDNKSPVSNDRAQGSPNVDVLVTKVERKKKTSNNNKSPVSNDRAQGSPNVNVIVTKIKHKKKTSHNNKLFISNSRAQGSPNVDVIVTEIERKKKTSIVDVKFNAGPSVASSVFVVCSFTKLANIRGYRYTAQIENYKKEGRYLLGFISSNSIDAISTLGTAFANDESYEIFDNEIFNSIC